MKYELFNTTKSVREVPKYNYRGVVTLQPKDTYAIEDYMTKFYLPYVKLGVVIRTVENREFDSKKLDVVECQDNLDVSKDVVKEDSVVDSTVVVAEDTKESAIKEEDTKKVVTKRRYTKKQVQ